MTMVQTQDYEKIYQDVVDLLELRPNFSVFGSSELVLHIVAIAENEFEKLKRSRLREYNKRIHQLYDHADRQKFLSGSTSMTERLSQLEPLKDRISDYVKKSLSQIDLMPGNNPLIDNYRAYSQLFKRLGDLTGEMDAARAKLTLQQNLLDAHMKRAVKNDGHAIKKHRKKASALQKSVESIHNGIVDIERDIKETKRLLKKKKGKVEEFQSELTEMEQKIKQGDFSKSELAALSDALNKVLELPDFNALFSNSYNYGGRN